MLYPRNAHPAFFSYIRFFCFMLVLSTLLVACGGSSGGGGSSNTNTSVSLNGQVYDQAVANANVTIYIGTQAVATARTDQNGNYSVNLSVSPDARSNRCVVVASRDNIKLRSLLGNIGAIADIASANGGKIDKSNLPSANVTNVSTAIAAVIENSAGTLPDSQTAIDLAVEAISASTTLQDNVVKIAAAVKAVVDYNGNPGVIGSATNTDELAIALAGSNNLATDLDTVVTSSDATSASQLETEVTGDPTLAEQIPSDAQVLITSLAGNTYATSNTLGEETLLVFQANSNAVTIASYDDIQNGGLSGTYTDNQDGTFSLDFTHPVDGTMHVVATVTGGSLNAIATNVTVSVNNGASNNEGPHILKRIIPIVNATSSATQVGVADVVGKTFINVANSTAVSIDACDGSLDMVSLLAASGSFSATCSLSLGMMVISDSANSNIISVNGLLADSWNGTALSQQMTIVSWTADTTYGSLESIEHVYQPMDSQVPASTKTLRIFPDRGDGSVGAQLRFVSVADTPDNVNATGKTDLYSYLGQNAGAKTKDSIVRWTHPDTGSLIVNGSVNEGVIDNNSIFWDSVTDSSVSIGINLGSTTNNGLHAIFAPYKAPTPTLRTYYSYSLSDITANDISGKTFNFSSFIYPDTGTITFGTDGTVTVSQGGQTASLTWAIEAATPANAITSNVTEHSTSTLVITDPNSGDKEYLFAKPQGDSMVIGGYDLDSSGNLTDIIAVMVTPQ